MGEAEQQHLDWLARAFAGADYRPLRSGDVESIQRAGEVITIAPGAHLFDEGVSAVDVYLIEAGEVELVRGSGRSRRVLARVGAGSVLGDYAMFRDAPHIATARAAGIVKARRFDRSRLLPELAVHPAILLRWMSTAMGRLEYTQHRLIALMDKRVLAQVADLLVEESQRQPNVNLSQSAIGALLGVSRQSVNEALGRLRSDGVLETGYRRVTILDRPRLREVAGE